ncbi:dihydrofolate reductase [Bombilactobacillus folatiphilus]|uniref:dihydrofolate reductase n=1 Tax=Bombilactobacillus folatiphilus TaxID=2923362 RepID=A0ABY4PAW0_9LACO|nr:dihydrofolate reductase [Bombilactobacillus folatiphilus]UQS82781.1 dihydrofolate reductase [Bombilactobacillus folatiphilus]
MLAFIWAEDQNHLIGQNGHLPWSLPADLHYLKQTTLNSTIVMGAKTFQSFPNGALPQRKNLVLSHEPQKFSNEKNIQVANSKVQLQKLFAHDSRVFIFGGPALFQMFLSEVQYLYVTQITAQFVGDTWMIPIDYSQFELIKRTQGTVDKVNLWPHEFLLYRRKNLEI